MLALCAETHVPMYLTHTHTHAGMHTHTHTTPASLSLQEPIEVYCAEMKDFSLFCP